MSVAVNEMFAAIYGTLTGGTALTSLLAGTASIYRSRAPAEADFDYVIMQLQGGGPTLRTSHSEIDDLVAVRCYSVVSPARAGTLSAQVDALLDGGTLSVSGWTAYNTRRETDLELSEVLPDGRTIWMAGGIYRVQLAK